MSKKDKKFEKFLVCPNCKSPIFRKSALKTMEPNNEYCTNCGTKIATTVERAMAKVRK